MNQALGEYITNSKFLPGQKQFVQSVIDKGFYLGNASDFNNWFEVSDNNVINMSVDYACYDEIK